MNAFWWAAAALVLFSVAAVLLPLLRGSSGQRAGRERVLASHRARLAEIEEDRARGTLEAEACAQARTEVEAALARELRELDAAGGVEPGAGAVRGRAWLTALATLMLIPAAALVVYLQVGAHDEARAVADQARAERAQQQSMDGLLVQLERRLQERPDDVEGLWLLGRSALQVGDSDKAAQALGRAWVLTGDRPELALDYAEALAGTQGNRLTGAPASLIARARALAPADPRTLWLSALVALEQGAPQRARADLQALQGLLEPGSEQARLVQAQLGALPPAAPATGTPPPAPQVLAGEAVSAGVPGPAPGEAPAARIEVRVELDPALAAAAEPGDTVFVFARAASGPPMPLAVARREVRDLPATVVLDDSMAMLPELSLSRFDEVRVGARVSRSGQAAPASGDLQGFAEGPVSTRAPAAEPIRVVMRERLP